MKNTRHKTLRDVTKEADGISYRYILTESTSLKVASFNLPLYSVSIIMTKCGVTTENTLSDVFADVGKAIVFFEKISEALATPIDLPYLLDDSKTTV
jgi:hypothetical protein